MYFAAKLHFLEIVEMQHHIECKDDNHMECSVSNTDLFTPVFVLSHIESDIFKEIFPLTNLGDERSWVYGWK